MYDSFNEPEKSFCSPPFFTSRHRYKMCTRIYLNGDGMGKGTHILLFFLLMRGEYDPLLRWPFRQKVTFMLLDQDNVEHVIDAFRPDPNSSCFQRPRQETNIASWCPLFLPLGNLNNHASIKDDAIFVNGHRWLLPLVEEKKKNEHDNQVACSKEPNNLVNKWASTNSFII